MRLHINVILGFFLFAATAEAQQSYLDDPECLGWIQSTFNHQTRDPDVQWPLDPQSHCPIVPPDSCRVAYSEFKAANPSFLCDTSNEQNVCGLYLAHSYLKAHERFSELYNQSSCVAAREANNLFPDRSFSELAFYLVGSAVNQVGGSYPTSATCTVQHAEELQTTCLLWKPSSAGIQIGNASSPPPTVSLSNQAREALSTYTNYKSRGYELVLHKWEAYRNLDVVLKNKAAMHRQITPQQKQHLADLLSRYLSSYQNYSFQLAYLWARVLQAQNNAVGTSAPGDFNRDGLRDLAFVYQDPSYSNSPRIAVWLQGRGAKNEVIYRSTGETYAVPPLVELSSLDVTGDGVLDLVLHAPSIVGGVRYLRGLGNGRFVETAAPDSGANVRIFVTDKLGRGLQVCASQINGSGKTCANLGTGTSSAGSLGTVGYFEKKQEGPNLVPYYILHLNSPAPGASYEFTASGIFRSDSDYEPSSGQMEVRFGDWSVAGNSVRIDRGKSLVCNLVLGATVQSFTDAHCSLQ